MAYLVGGFFGFIKKAFKKVAKVVGKVGGTALGIASVALPGPTGRLIGSVGGKLAGAKRAYARASSSVNQVGRLAAGGSVTRGAIPGLLSKQSTVMPGGSLAVIPAAMRPVSRRAPTKRKRKRSTAKRRSTGKRRKGPKFGSPAWRKKYHLPAKRRR